MPHLPHRRLDAILSALIPPASREHVLGDLAECSHSLAQYLTAFAAVLPRVVFGQVQRKLRAGSGLGLMAALSATTLAVAALATSGPSMLASGGWTRWAAPWGAWMLGCALAAAYGPAGTRLWSGWSVLAAFGAGVGAADAAGAHAGAAAGALVAATVAHVVFTAGHLKEDIERVVAAAAVKTPLSFDNLSERAHTFQRTIWWRNARESVAAIVLLAMNAKTLLTTQPESAAGWAAPVLGIAGVACLLYLLHGKAGSRRVPAGLDERELLRFHQGEIARQRDMLLRVPWWYLLPLVPMILAGTIEQWHPVSGPLGLLFMGLLFYGVARVNRWGAKWLDRQLAEAQALDAGPVR